MTDHPPGCPPWCTVAHDELEGEDALVHAGTPLQVVDGIAARLVAGDAEAVYVLLGGEERTLEDTEALGAALIGLATAGDPSARAAPGTRSPGPAPAAS